MTEKYALIIGNSNYQDSRLGRLIAPSQDVRALADALLNSEIGGFTNVNVIIDRPFSVFQKEITTFFEHRSPEDTLLLYFSGHGLLDENGQLYLASIETKVDQPHALSLDATLISKEMGRSRSRKQILILDCCHSGAYLQQNAKSGQAIQHVGTENIFRGEGRIVLTASDTTELAYEGSNNRSVFTHHLVEGLLTGSADRDGDNLISVDEWYEYAYECIAQTNVRQTPMKSSYGSGKMIIAHVPIGHTSDIDFQDPHNMRTNYPAIATSLDELDKILRGIPYCTPTRKGEGAPSTVDFSIFSAFPYFDEMKKAWEKGNNAVHIQNAIAFMNQILITGRAKGRDTEEFFKRHRLDEDYSKTKDFYTFIRDALANFGEDAERIDAFFRVAAFYHDIGKYINKERHPTIGWYIVQNLGLEQRRALEHILDGKENSHNGKLSLFRLLMIMLRDHDLFGVLSTGEASHPILLNAITNSDDTKEQIKIISALMLLNLADISATVPHLNWTIIDKLVEDYVWFKENLEIYEKTKESEGKKNNKMAPMTNVHIESFDDFVIRVSSQEDRVCKRIHRLVTTTVEDLRSLDEEQYDQNDWILDVKVACTKLESELEALNDIRVVKDAYHTVFSSDTSRREFASIFTHICKLDYGKRFFNRLIGYWMLEANAIKADLAESIKKNLNSKAKEPQPIDAVYRLFAVLRRFTGTYEAMVRSSGTLSGSLIGVEMKDLAPDGAPEKPFTIAKLISENHYPGLTWMMSDTPAWFF